MTHRFSVSDNGGVRVSVRDPGEVVELHGSASLTTDWSLLEQGITPVNTYCTIYNYATYELNGYKLSYFGIEVDDKYATKPHRVVAHCVATVWSIEISLISQVGGPGDETPPGNEDDDLIKVDPTDPTPGYLFEKLTHGPEIELSIDITDPDFYTIKIENEGPFTRYSDVETGLGYIKQRFPGQLLHFYDPEGIIFPDGGNVKLDDFQNTVSTIDWKDDNAAVSALAIDNYLNDPNNRFTHTHLEVDITDLNRMRWMNIWAG